MPVFHFEKISPPVRRARFRRLHKKQRGVIVQILDRFVEARVKRALQEEKGVIAAQRRHQPADRALSMRFSACAAAGCSSPRSGDAAPAPARARDRRR